ncbi:MAG: hypothetical protein LUC97_11850 [Clostridiales bacterium]|nr:hypothetical protein [Clostridiales bacterium]
MIKIERDKINLDKCLKELESIGKKIEKKTKELTALKEKKTELNGTIIQSVLKDNKITLGELVSAVNETYADKESSNVKGTLLKAHEKNTEMEEIND